MLLFIALCDIYHIYFYFIMILFYMFIFYIYLNTIYYIYISNISINENMLLHCMYHGEY